MDQKSESKRVGGTLVTGATGLVGGRLLPGLRDRFAWIRTLSRSGTAAEADLDARSWDGTDPGPAALDGVDTIVHLAGEPIFGGLPTEARLERVRSSRVDSTRRIVDRIGERPSSERPSTFVCASAVGYYGDAGDRPLDENAPPGDGFLSRVCRDWEAEASKATEHGVRVVSVRIGVVLAREGGALALMKRPFSFGLGGRLGSGRQYFPWVHVDDLARAFLYCIDTPLEGPVNGVAPESVTNRELTRALADALDRPAILPVPEFAIRLALGEVASELLESKRVVPARLDADGFHFEHPTLESALAAALG